MSLNHPQAIQGVDEFLFIWIDLDKFSIKITWSPMDPLQWMGAVRTSQEADENITSNPYDSSPLINILWSEKLLVLQTNPSLTNPSTCF